MDVIRAMKERRSVRRYTGEKVPRDVLEEIADVARYAPTGGNAQRWQIILVDDSELIDDVFVTLTWLPGVGEPTEGARPSAYMVIISDKKSNMADCASLSTYITLAALAKGLGSCWFGAIRRTELMAILDIPEHYSIEFVISLGYPDEKFEVFDSEETAVGRKDDVTQVPKLGLDKILCRNTFQG